MIFQKRRSEIFQFYRKRIHQYIICITYILVGKKSKTIFDFWLMLENTVSNFRLEQFAKVVPFCDLYGAYGDINNIDSLDNSGSNETMRKVLASIA